MSQPAAPRPATLNRSRPLEGVREQLIRRGMPLDYAERSVAELEDHHADLVDELRRGGAPAGDAERRAAERLGEPKQLVRRIVRDYQRRTLCGRWPLISFVLAPLPLLILGQGAFTGVFAASCVIMDWWGVEEPSSAVFSAIGTAFLSILFLVVPPAVVYGWGRVALLATRNRYYAGAVSLVVGSLVGSIYWDACFSAAQNKDVLIIGTAWITPSVSAGIRTYLQPTQLFQLLAPLAVGGWLIYGETKRRRRALRMEPPTQEHRVAA